MGRKMFLILVGLGLIIFWGVRIRGRQRYSYPPVQTTFDEIGFVWLGQSLLWGGVPMDWSSYINYFGEDMKGREAAGLGDGGLLPRVGETNKELVYLDKEMAVDGYKSQFRLVQPCLDNPPLAGIFFGGVNLRQGGWANSLKNSRDAMVWWSVPVMLGVFGLSFRLGGGWAALLATLIYAASPGYVISSRMGLPENLLAGLLVWGVWGALEQAIRPRRWLGWGVAAVALAAPLVKISGLIAAGSMAAIFFGQKKYRWGWITACLGVAGVAVYLLWGWSYNGEVLKQVLLSQGNREFAAGPITFLTRMIIPRVPVLMIDGWIILGYIATWMLLLINKPKYRGVALAVVMHNIFFALFAGYDFPWYQFILFPVLATAGGWIVVEFIKKPKWEFNALFFFGVLSPLLYYLKLGTKWSEYIGFYRLMVTLVTAVPAALVILRGNKHNRWVSLVLAGMFVAGIFLSSKLEANMNILWEMLRQGNLKLL